MKWVPSIVLALLATACVDDRCNTPFGEGAVIDVASAEYSILATVGGTATVNRGHRGIIVRCDGQGSYSAFEMSCPNDNDTRMLPDERDYAVMLTCPACGSSFDIIYGNPMKNSATPCPLFQYSTSFDGQYISIW